MFPFLIAVVVKMAREAYQYIIFFGVFTLVAGLFGMYLSAGLFAFLLLFVIYFFRDPERVAPAEAGIVVAPADGRVTKVEKMNPDGANSDASPHLISIFLSPLDVHINRAPIAGRISQVSHVKGRFVSATRPDASLVNEQNVP